MKRLFCLLAALGLLLTLGGCGGAGPVLRYDLPGGVANLDPQFATGAAERMVISNTFEGLFRQLSTGEVVPCLAESYEVSEDGLRYTFHLRRDAAWSGNGVKARDGGWAGGTPVTAHDFAFALRRMFDPAAPSPFAVEFSALQNATAVLEGGLPASLLGIFVPDDYTLQLRLDRPDNLLPERLAASYSMPCNEAFFRSTMARYGLDLQSLLFNGPFYLRSWTESTLALRQNEYCATPAAPAGVNLALTGEDPGARFLAGASDAARVSFSDLAAVREAGGEVTSFEDTVWVLLINNRLDLGTEEEPLLLFGNENLRLAVAHAVDRDLFKERLPANLRAASTLVPPAAPFLGWPFRTLAGEDSPIVSSPELAKRYLANGLEDAGLSGMPSLRLLVCEDYGQPELAGYLQQGITRSLSTYCGLEVLPRDQLLQRVRAGDFMLAVVPLTADYASPEAVLSAFRSDAPANFSGYRDPEFDALLDAASTLTGGELLTAFERAESMLLERGAVVPLYFETSYYASAEGVSGVAFSPFLSGVDFRDATKE